MPGKNTIKTYEAQAYYHLYNRGVNKQRIFLNDQDYGVFLSYLKTYLEPKDEVVLLRVLADKNAPWREKDHAAKLLRLNNFFNTIMLLSFCFMSNHFHFLVRQTDADAIDRFMNSLCTRYTMYFNKKYKRVGPLFQSTYKAVRIANEGQLLYLSRYIHRNPIEKKYQNALSSRILSTFQYSSYPNYLGIRRADWIKPEEILNHFKTPEQTYQSFTEDTEHEENSVRCIGKLMLDEN